MMRLLDWVYGSFIAGLTGTIVLLTQNGIKTASPDYAFVSTDRLIVEARSYLQSEMPSKERAELELLTFTNFLQQHMDELTQSGEVQVLLNADSVLGGDFDDYTDLVFLKAKDSYEDSRPSKTLLGSAKTLGMR